MCCLCSPALLVCCLCSPAPLCCFCSPALMVCSVALLHPWCVAFAQHPCVAFPASLCLQQTSQFNFTIQHYPWGAPRQAGGVLRVVLCCVSTARIQCIVRKSALPLCSRIGLPASVHAHSCLHCFICHIPCRDCILTSSVLTKAFEAIVAIPFLLALTIKL